MATPFGATSTQDHFGVLALSATGGGTLADKLTVVSATKTPIEKSRVDAMDQNGDVAASAYHYNEGGTLYEATTVFALQATLRLSDIKLGELSTGKTILSLELSTENGGFPQITVSGKIGYGAITAPSGKANTFTLPTDTLDISNLKAAQALGFTVDTGRLTACSLSASIEEAEQQDGEGENLAHGIAGGTGSITADFVQQGDDAPAWSSLESWLTEMKAPSAAEQPQAGFHTGQGTAGFTLSRDDA